MIQQKDIDNVREIMNKSRRFFTTTEEKKKLADLIKGFDDVADKYLQEVSKNATLQQCYR
jgi:hypothetical protein